MLLWGLFAQWALTHSLIWSTCTFGQQLVSISEAVIKNSWTNINTLWISGKQLEKRGRGTCLLTDLAAIRRVSHCTLQSRTAWGSSFPPDPSPSGELHYPHHPWVPIHLFLSFLLPTLSAPLPQVTPSWPPLGFSFSPPRPLYFLSPLPSIPLSLSLPTVGRWGTESTPGIIFLFFTFNQKSLALLNFFNS